MGLHAYVYRTGVFNAAGTFLTRHADCTNGGWSSHFSEVCVVNANGPFQPDETHPAVIVRKHPTLRNPIALHVVLEAHDGVKQTMFGGNYLACSDSRLWELCERLGASRYHGAISIHDRIEG